MPKQRRKMSVLSNNMTRVSPYPLRSTRKDSQIVPVSPIETEGPTQWKDVQCVICMDPPHNAVLLHCSSFHNGCRAYICDTSARHSNCLRQFRKNHKDNRLSNKSPDCPLCRGEVFEVVKLPLARRFMNKKSRSCVIENCKFSGTYSQLNTHVKIEHHDFIPPKTGPTEQLMQNLREREIQYIEMLIASGFAPTPEVVRNRPPLSQHHTMIVHRNDAILHDISSPNWAPTNSASTAEYGWQRSRPRRSRSNLSSSLL